MKQRLHVLPSVRTAITCMVGVAVAVICLAVAHIEIRQRVIRHGYQLNDALHELRKLEEENRRLRTERALLTHPDRVQRLAHAMGLRAPLPTQCRDLGAEENR